MKNIAVDVNFEYQAEIPVREYFLALERWDGIKRYIEE